MTQIFYLYFLKLQQLFNKGNHIRFYFTFYRLNFFFLKKAYTLYCALSRWSVHIGGASRNAWRPTDSIQPKYIKFCSHVMSIKKWWGTRAVISFLCCVLGTFVCLFVFFVFKHGVLSLFFDLCV